MALPCSEASVERVFSHLKIIVGDHRHSLRDDILEALLTIRLNNNRNVVELCHRLEAICGELSSGQPVDPPAEPSEKPRAGLEGLGELMARGLLPPPPCSPSRAKEKHHSTACSQPQQRVARWSEKGIASRIIPQFPGKSDGDCSQPMMALDMTKQ
jgi:hypothetical protein